MAITETAVTDSKTVMKGTTEQNETDSQDERINTHQVLFCSVVPFLSVAAVSVVAITVSIDKNSNHSKNKYPQYRVNPLILTTKQCAGGALRLGELSDCDTGITVRSLRTI